MNKALTILSAALLISGILSAKSLSVPYQINFENGAPGWSQTNNGLGTVWELGTPNYGLTTGSFSGNTCWDTNLNVGYDCFAESYLYTPTFDLSGLSDARVSFYTQFHVEHLWDYLLVQYSADGGANWIFLPFPNLMTADGTSSKWLRSELDISDLIGFTDVQFRFQFVSDATITYDGYSIDDFTIETTPLGINNISPLANTSVFPNPGNGEFYISGPDNQLGDLQVEVFNESGLPVQFSVQKDPHSELIKLNITNPSNGYYFLRMISNSYYDNRKMVVMQ